MLLDAILPQPVGTHAHKRPHACVFKGCRMGPWLVLVSLCFRENVVATCKIGSFLCSLDNLLQKKRNFSLFLEIKFQNGAHLKKRAIFNLLFTFSSHQGKVTKISFSTCLTHIHTRILPTFTY